MVYRDAEDQPYVEIPSWDGPEGREHIRVTYIADAPHGSVFRIRVRDTNGHLRPGPDIDIASAHQFMGGIKDLLNLQEVRELL